MNVFLDNTTHIFWEESVVDYFKKTGRWEEVVYERNTSGMCTVDYYEKCILNKLNGIKYIPDAIYKKVYNHFLVFADMYSRNSPLSQHSYNFKNLHEYLNIFNLLANYFYTIFFEKNIDLFIIQRAPHLGIDYLKCVLAKEMGIKTLILEQSMFPNRFFYLWDINDFGDFKTSKELFEKQEISIEKKYEKSLFYMKPQKKTMRDKILPSYSGVSIRNAIKPENILSTLYNRQIFHNFKKNNKKIVSDSIDYTVDFIYFALHLQPEKTTSLYGGLYNDQALAIERLSQMAPKGWYVYVKENPKQKGFMRDNWFYKRISILPNVKVVPNNTDTYYLIRNAKLVSTITGTAGWESITGGKNVLIFGKGVWYKRFPGVYEYSPDLDLQEIAKKTIIHSDIEKAVSNLTPKMAKGVIYSGGYEKTVESYSEEKNIETIIQSLSIILDAEGV